MQDINLNLRARRAAFTALRAPSPRLAALSGMQADTDPADGPAAELPLPSRESQIRYQPPVEPQLRH